MRLVFRNIKNSIKGYRSVYITLIISQIISIIMLFFAYGVFGSFNLSKQEYNAENYTMGAYMNIGANVYIDEFIPVFTKILEQTEPRMNYFVVIGERNEEGIMIRTDNEYHNGRFSGSRKCMERDSLSSGRFATEEEINSGAMVAVTEDVGVVGETIEFGGAEYKITGKEAGRICKTISVSLMAFPDKWPIDAFSIHFEKLPTAKDYEVFKTELENAFGDKVVVEETEILDREKVIAMNSIITMSVLIGVIAALDTALLYGYIVEKRRKQMAIMGILGAKRIDRILINEVEIMFVTIITSLIGWLLFQGVFEELIQNIYENVVEIYYGKVYAIMVGIYILCVFIITLILTILSTGNRFLQLKKANNGKVLFGKYVRNIWFNVVSVLIITVTIMMSTIYISNITAQTKLYRLVSPYLNENSIFMEIPESEFDINSLTKLEKTLMTKCLACHSNEMDVRKCHVYNSEVMSVMPPRLSDGRQIGTVDMNDDRIEVLISDNVKSYGVGDEITIKYPYVDLETMIESEIDIKCEIVGVIAEGQKLFINSGEGDKDVSIKGYEDLYLTYSYEQIGSIIMITTEEQLSKLDLELYYLCHNAIFKFEEDITKEERAANQLKVTKYETDRGRSATNLQASLLTEKMEADHRNIILKYVPLTIGMIILVTVCVVGIISIKNAKSMRYYSTLYICGMNSTKAVILCGRDMLINCIIATALGITLMTVQNKMEIIDTINCEIGALQVLTIIVLSVIMILMSMSVTNTVMKERSPMDILKDTTF